MALFEPARHESLDGGAWDEALARAAIARIAADTHAAFAGREGLWPIHPLDVSPERPDPMKNLYYGAAGVIWGLTSLAERGFAPMARDYRPALDGLAERIADDALRIGGEPSPGFMAGEAGARMLLWRLTGEAALLDRIEANLAAMIGHRSRGWLGGGPGAMAGALHMLAATGADRWADLARRHAQDLWDAWTYDPSTGGWFWVHDLYGAAERRLGCLHGFAGVAHGLLRAGPLLGAERAAQAARRIAATLSATALREGAFANWRMSLEVTDGPYGGGTIVQHCMGAPGMVNGCAALPADPATDDLLRAAGALTWAAGPVAKIPGLCHGAPGAGYALLKLYARTGDPAWLERARRLAMHAIGQADRFLAEHGRRKHSVWTGDLGLALYLASCVEVDARIPMLDVF